MPGHRSRPGAISSGNSRSCASSSGSVVAFGPTASRSSCVMLHLHVPAARCSSARARCSCALQVPTATPSICAASSCEWPYSPTSTSTCRAPAGSPAIAASTSRLRPGSSRQRIRQPVGHLALDRIRLAQRFLAASRLLQHRVDRDAVQPGAERAARLELAEIAPGLHEGFLHAVLGGRHVAGHAQAHGVHAGGMTSIELLESRGRAARRRRDQLPLGGGVPRTLQLVDDSHRLQQESPR